VRAVAGVVVLTLPQLTVVTEVLVVVVLRHLQMVAVELGQPIRVSTVETVPTPITTVFLMLALVAVVVPVLLVETVVIPLRVLVVLV
jgi:hypothetical protein